MNHDSGIINWVIRGFGESWFKDHEFYSFVFIDESWFMNIWDIGTSTNSLAEEEEQD